MCKVVYSGMGANMRIVSGFILREVVGETVAIPSGDSAHLLSGLVALNEPGQFLFRLLQTDRTQQELVQAMLEEYDVDAASAETDVAEYPAMLRHHRLLIEG